MYSGREEDLRVSMHSSYILHDGLVLERQMLKVLGKRVETVVDVIIIGISSYNKIKRLIWLSVTKFK
jgi:hypothetical protein